MAMIILFWLLLFLVFYTYIGYGMLLWVLVKIKEIIKPPHKVEELNEYPHVTLLIAAYNEEDIVDSKMQNTLELDYPKDKFHIVWVTDGSNDNTVNKLNSYSEVKVLHDPQRNGKTAAINRAMPFIDTPIVIFTDANTMINKEAIKEIVKKFIDTKVGCVAGEKQVQSQSQDNASSSGEGFYWRYESALKSLDSRLYSVVGAAGELYAIRTHLFEIMPNNTLLDDFILSLKIAEKGYKVAYCPQAYAIEDGSADMKEEEKRKVRIAAGGLQSIGRLRGLLNIFKHGTLSFQYISHRVLRWTITPIALFLLLPINIIICTQSSGTQLTFYTVLLALQCLFYILGFLGYILSKNKIKVKALFVPYYFLFMNINVFKGAIYLRKKGKSGAWEKAKRKV